VRRFWNVQIRYRLARRLIHTALWVMPEGRYKSELLACLWFLYDKVAVEVATAQPTPAVME
jgi:hypothetical protein